MAIYTEEYLEFVFRSGTVKRIDIKPGSLISDTGSPEFWDWESTEDPDHDELPYIDYEQVSAIFHRKMVVKTDHEP